MSEKTNRQVRLASRPRGPVSDANWEFTAEPIPTPSDGEALVQIECVSVDPAMRGWMNEGRSYIPGVEVGAVMRAATVGRVIESHDPALPTDTCVLGMQGVQQYALGTSADLIPVDPADVPLERFLGGLGGAGITAYFGLLDIGRPEEGDVVVISAAAGSVGAIAGQIAKIHGCRVIGIVGGPEKCRHITEDLGFDTTIDRHAENIDDALREACPKGIDIYFDNVGGELLDLALKRLATGGRVVLCGAIARYNDTEMAPGPAHYTNLIVRCGRMQGFITFDYRDRYAEAYVALRNWLEEGRLYCVEDVSHGIDSFPATFLRLFTGKKLGKLVVRLTDPGQAEEA